MGEGVLLPTPPSVRHWVDEGVKPPVHVYRHSFWVKIGYKFQSLGKISISFTSDQPQFF